MPKLLWENAKRAAPVVEVDGKAVMTRDGIPVEVPPHTAPLYGGGELFSVPDEIETVVL